MENSHEKLWEEINANKRNNIGFIFGGDQSMQGFPLSLTTNNETMLGMAQEGLRTFVLNS